MLLAELPVLWVEVVLLAVGGGLGGSEAVVVGTSGRATDSSSRPARRWSVELPEVDWFFGSSTSILIFLVSGFFDFSSSELEEELDEEESLDSSAFRNRALIPSVSC